MGKTQLSPQKLDQWSPMTGKDRVAHYAAMHGGVSRPGSSAGHSTLHTPKTHRIVYYKTWTHMDVNFKYKSESWEILRWNEDCRNESHWTPEVWHISSKRVEWGERLEAVFEYK